MSIVIVGGNDRMVYEYKKLCKNYGCKVKVFTQMASDFKSKIGTPDLLVLFTNTVSHKMVVSALQESVKKNVAVERSHSSSSCALKGILDKYCAC